MALLCSEDKLDYAANVAAPILKQCGDVFLSAKSVRATTAFKNLANAFFNWHLISIAKKRGLLMSAELDVVYHPTVWASWFSCGEDVQAERTARTVFV